MREQPPRRDGTGTILRIEPAPLREHSGSDDGVMIVKLTFHQPDCFLARVLVVVCALSLTACTPRAHSGGAAGVALLDVARAVGSAPAEVDRVWPGFTLREGDWIVYVPGDSALLVTSRVAPSEFERVPDAILPAPLHGRTYQLLGPLPGLSAGFDTDYPLGDGRVTAVPLRAPLVQAMVFLYHEAFHAHQRHAFAALPPPDALPVEVVQPRFAAMGEVERRLLATAMMAQPGERTDLLGRYLAVRWLRTEDLPAGVRDVERYWERHEGVTDFVGFSMGVRSLGSNLAPARAATVSQLRRPLREFGGAAEVRLSRWRAYGIGGALAFLLDDLEAPGWRDRVAAGDPLDDLMAEAIAFDTATAPALAATALDEHGFVDLLGARRPPWGTLDRGLEVEEFLRRAPARLVVEIMPGDSAARFAVNFDVNMNPIRRWMGQRTGADQPATGMTMVYRSRLATLPAMQIDLRSQGRDFMLDTRAWPERGVITVLLPRSPSVDGRRLAPGTYKQPAGVTIRGRGVALNTRHPATVRVTDGEVRVTIHTPAGEP